MKAKKQNKTKKNSNSPQSPTSPPVFSHNATFLHCPFYDPACNYVTAQLRADSHFSHLEPIVCAQTDSAPTSRNQNAAVVDLSLNVIVIRTIHLVHSPAFRVPSLAANVSISGKGRVIFSVFVLSRTCFPDSSWCLQVSDSRTR